MKNFNLVKEHLLENKYNWLVTGAGGFIGSNLLEFLLSYNQSVVALDNFSTGYKKNINMALKEASESNYFDKKNFSLVEEDIQNLDSCISSTRYIDFVLHQAALGSVPRSIENPIQSNKSNIDGFLNMLFASKENSVKRFVFAASSSSYGDHIALPKREDIIGKPLSPYAVTKLANELYAHVFSNCYGLDYIGLRYFNVFGKRQDPNGAYAAVIPKWIGSMIKGDEVFINGDGNTSRDFCYIDNVIQMNILSALSDNRESINQIYNVALGDRTSLKELYDHIQAELKAVRPGINLREPTYRAFRKGDIAHSQADISKAKELVGYSPTHRVRQGLEESMKWYSENLMV